MLSKIGISGKPTSARVFNQKLCDEMAKDFGLKGSPAQWDKFFTTLGKQYPIGGYTGSTGDPRQQDDNGNRLPEGRQWRDNRDLRKKPLYQFLKNVLDYFFERALSENEANRDR